MWIYPHNESQQTSTHSISSTDLLRDQDVVDSHFAKIAFKKFIWPDHTELDGFRRECNSENFDPLSNIEVEALLRNIKMSAAGCDRIPAWLLRSCSYELADIVTHIISCLFATGKVPS